MTSDYKLGCVVIMYYYNIFFGNFTKQRTTSTKMVIKLSQKSPNFVHKSQISPLKRDATLSPKSQTLDWKHFILVADICWFKVHLHMVMFNECVICSILDVSQCFDGGASLKWQKRICNQIYIFKTCSNIIRNSLKDKIKWSTSLNVWVLKNCLIGYLQKKSQAALLPPSMQAVALWNIPKKSK